MPSIIRPLPTSPTPRLQHTSPLRLRPGEHAVLIDFHPDGRVLIHPASRRPDVLLLRLRAVVHQLTEEGAIERVVGILSPHTGPRPDGGARR